MRTRQQSSQPADGRVRVVVEHLEPEIDAGRFAIKRTVGERVDLSAWIHGDGHDVVAAAARYRPLTRPASRWMESAMRPIGNDEWSGAFRIDRQAPYEYTVDAWIDRFESWRRDLAARAGAGQDVASDLLEGALLIRAARARARKGGAAEDAAWLEERADAIGRAGDSAEAARLALEGPLAERMRRHADRAHAASYPRILSVDVDRERARFSAWYEMFPRSWGPDPTRGGTFREAAGHLPRIAEMGFNVVYLPPIHPIGTRFRKGRGNALQAAPGDPGSPWAIGSEAGGHKAVDPGLGTLQDFDHFVAQARRLGLEVALDIAFQCSPDHPYVREHPEWFRRRPDGTIKYAENPPKKYQDIYPFDFECADWLALWRELKSIVEFWIGHGVSIFRVDNPHTKPSRLWEWLIREVRRNHPDAIFLAEAFTRPKIMHYLAKLGFSQSYTYFTWRNTKEELTDYFSELTRPPVADFFRPNLFANTPDILHAFLQTGGRPAFQIRLILAATLGANYGIYSGFELCENRAVPGTEEYLASEKYEIRRRDVESPGHIRDLVTAVNRIRRDHPALHADRSLAICPTDNPQLLAYCKRAPGRSDALLVVVNLDVSQMQHGWVTLPLQALGLPSSEAYEVLDLLDGTRYTWRGTTNYVRLDPRESVAHIFALPGPLPADAERMQATIAQLLPAQRWFAAKHRRIAAVRLTDWSYDGTIIPAIATVELSGAPADRYFVPLAPVRGDFADAMTDDAACRATAQAMLTGSTIPLEHGVVRGTTFEPRAEMTDEPIIRSRAEQSNSAVRFGDAYVLKIFRRLDPGPNPEVEMLQFLSKRRLTFIPSLAATLDYELPGDATIALAVMERYIPNQGTGWDVALQDVRRFLDSGGAAADVPFAAAAATLGRRTAELHLALARGGADPAFAVEETTPQAAARFGAAIEDDAARVMAALSSALDRLPADAIPLARAVLDGEPRMAARIAGAAAAAAGSRLTRVHGDFHLGQVLATRGGDFAIIDFEGEPARPLAARRTKYTPLKDVAGMLRSFAYAARAGMHAAGGDAERDRLDLLARRWESAVGRAFLTQYRKSIARAGIVPGGEGAFARLLDACLLEKTMYEIGYELASRPAWIAIPLAGLLEQLRQT